MKLDAEGKKKKGKKSGGGRRVRRVSRRERKSGECPSSTCVKSGARSRRLRHKKREKEKSRAEPFQLRAGNRRCFPPGGKKDSRHYEKRREQTSWELYLERRPAPWGTGEKRRSRFVFYLQKKGRSNAAEQSEGGGKRGDGRFRGNGSRGKC